VSGDQHDHTRCHARPLAAAPAARRRSEGLCASSATRVVQFRSLELPVCRLHEATYAHWGVDAELQAASRWGWGVWSASAVAAFASVAELLSQAG
jgi:hypothetical protein